LKTWNAGKRAEGFVSAELLQQGRIIPAKAAAKPSSADAPSP
jgi:hypothetical protein